MPARPCSICRHPACGVTIAKPGYCNKHQRPAGGWRDDRERGSRHARGYGADWERTRARILGRSGGLCECDECARLGRVRLATEVDHIVPKARGGTDDDDNLQAINVECHRAKTVRERRKPKRQDAPGSRGGRWVAGAWVMPRSGR
ncbi:HNH endonuclease [Ralstonia pseudosolanacearum]|uniref:HNH endonuclease n=1 Tax=Ralstonia solanacearum TaxID=305 RepID=A0AA92QB86_RALSL|nr:HNH endonuclease signature motif containing protein [Ralstonia pseudosolanacearum]QOK96571.1 HNH endonuclease [Ralstonia pseudosolanacearum]